VNDKQGDDKKVQSVTPLKADSAEEPKAVDSVSEQLEKLNVGAECDGTKTSEPQSAGDTVVTSS